MPFKVHRLKALVRISLLKSAVITMNTLYHSIHLHVGQ